MCFVSKKDLAESVFFLIFAKHFKDAESFEVDVKLLFIEQKGKDRPHASHIENNLPRAG